MSGLTTESVLGQIDMQSGAKVLSEETADVSGLHIITGRFMKRLKKLLVEIFCRSRGYNLPYLQYLILTTRQIK